MAIRYTRFGPHYLRYEALNARTTAWKRMRPLNHDHAGKASVQTGFARNPGCRSGGEIRGGDARQGPDRNKDLA
jgi:hypothetical protein